MRKYNHALWCTKKHLLLANMHSQETLQKLARECNGVCDISYPTRLESECIVKNLVSAEEHLIDEIIPQVNDKKMKDKLLKISDEIREVRQEITSSGLPFRSDVYVDKSVVSKLINLHKKIDNFITEIDKYATEMEQEQQVYCPKCEEDLKLIISMFGTKNRTKNESILNSNENNLNVSSVNKSTNKGDGMDFESFGIKVAGTATGVIAADALKPRVESAFAGSASSVPGGLANWVNVLAGLGVAFVSEYTLSSGAMSDFVTSAGLGMSAKGIKGLVDNFMGSAVGGGTSSATLVLPPTRTSPTRVTVRSPPTPSPKPPAQLSRKYI